jgi:hypothetical protein
MFFPPAMLRPAFTFLLTLPRFSTMFPTAGTTLVPIPIGSLNSERVSDRRGHRMSRRRGHRSDCQRAKNYETSHDVAHCITSSE